MNVSRALSLILVLLVLGTSRCIAQQAEATPASSSASQLSADSREAEREPAILAKPEFAESPLLYFPIGAFEQNPQLSRRKENWYSQFLFVMGEPSLLALSKTADTKVYRFLLILNHRALSFRLTVNADGSGSLTTKAVVVQTKGPDSFQTKVAIPVSKDQVADFLNLLKKIQFWSAEPERLMEDNRYKMDNGEWVLEGVSNHQYHVIDRWAPEDSDFTRTSLFLMQLARNHQ